MHVLEKVYKLFDDIIDNRFYVPVPYKPDHFNVPFRVLKALLVVQFLNLNFSFVCVH